MPLDLPDSPATNATYTFGGVTWKYDGAKWRLLGTTLDVPLVTNLPTSPTDGQEVYYQASGDMATNGIVWHLRYRSGSSSSYKWEFLGGSPLTAGINGESSISGLTANIWGDLGGAAISLTVPLAGDYFVEAESNLYRSPAYAACNNIMGIKQHNTEGALSSYIYLSSALVWQYASVSGSLLAVGASQSIALRYRADSTGEYLRKAAIVRVRPIRVI